MRSPLTGERALELLTDLVEVGHLVPDDSPLRAPLCRVASALADQIWHAAHTRSELLAPAPAEAVSGAEHEAANGNGGDEVDCG